MRYVHDGKLIKYKQSFGVEQIDDNTYCFVYSYCSPKDQYSKKVARQVIDLKYQNALVQRDETKDCSVVIHEIDGGNVIDSLVIKKDYLINIIYTMYFPKGIFKALIHHTDIQPFNNMDLLGFESKELKQLAIDLRKFALANFFSKE